MSFLDIDAQKKSAESLRETRDYLDNLIDHANAPIIVWDPQLKITRFNRAFERLTGRRAELANQAIEELHQHPSEHSILLDIPDGLPQVVVDPVRFQRVLHNLVENAIKYSPKRTEIRIFARQENRKVVVGVSDQGPGISVQDQKRLFEPFQRLGLKPTTSGVGLGLEVCKRLVEAHGGSIWVESKPGEGAAFLFTIPLGNRRGKLAVKADGLQKLDV